MAEIFGIDTSALSIAGFFTNCVDCFEYIQLGRHFGRDFAICQLKLDVARARLGRWGQAARVLEDPRFALPFLSDEGADTYVKIAKKTFEEIEGLLMAARRKAEKYELCNGSDKKKMETFDAGRDMDGVRGGLHERLKRVARKKQDTKSSGGGGGGVKLYKKAAWALYEVKEFDKLATEVLALLDELEELCSVPEVEYKKLVEVEVVELGTKESLEVLKGVAEGMDDVLVDAVVKRLRIVDPGREDRNYVQQLNVGDTAQVQVGHEYAETVLLAAGVMPSGVTNEVDVVMAKGLSKVHVGNRFGVRF
ncbi:prion-inhibition and propagation-domain-containing protein [Lasiosphaeris hirsuta]|uniref:Prion-inhibition and propagation-domain-containing protein n=1 Tax=Lasiosphaeris hirsuta TaxID=260670 RepID=A0AA39ZVB0_9PEZI|nr:prion-inhibition and propagation-domain-containing protein [Lasiosphaeris hirsuta]